MGATRGAEAGWDRPTVGRRWRQRRDLVILVAHAQGVPQHVLADVFDIAQSRVSAIVTAAKSDRAGSRQDRLTQIREALGRSKK